MRIFAILLAILLVSKSAAAAEITILPWPKNGADMRPEDYAEALNLVGKYAPETTLMSLWGWERLEPDKGETNLSKEIAGLNYALKDKGFRTYCGLTVIDTVKRVMPEDLQEKNWDDPELVTRYGKVLDQLSREIFKRPEYFVIANEADVYFDKHPEEIDAFMGFAAAAKREIRSRFPQAVIGISVTYEGLHKGGQRADFIKRVIAASDAAFFTYYPVLDLKPTRPAQTPAQLDDIINAAQGKAVILQEIGYPSGLAGSSPQLQADFFATIIPAIIKRPQIKLASIFALHDFDPKMCKILTGYYGFGGLLSLTPWVKDFRNFICTLGLREADGTPKPAWDAAIGAMRDNRP